MAAPDLYEKIMGDLEDFNLEDWNALETFLQLWEDVAAAILVADGVEEEAGPDAIPAVLATDVIGAVILLAIALVICVLGNILVFTWILSKALPDVPIVKGWAVTVVEWISKRVTSWIFDLCDHIAKTESHIFRALRQLVQYWGHLVGWQTRSDVSSHLEHVLRTAIWPELHHLQKTEEALNSDLHAHQTGIYAQLHRAEAEIVHINESLTKVWRDLNSHHGSNTGTLQHELKLIDHRLGNVERTITHLPTDERKIAEIETTLQRLTKEVEQLQRRPSGHGLSPRQANELQSAYGIAEKLAPLIGLAPFTALRLGNLRKLEDDPCQCGDGGGGGKGPRLPGNLDIDALVGDLILTQGV